MSISEFERRKKSDIETVKGCIISSKFYQEYAPDDINDELTRLVKEILVKLDKNRVTNE